MSGGTQVAGREAYVTAWHPSPGSTCAQLVSAYCATHMPRTYPVTVLAVIALQPEYARQAAHRLGRDRERGFRGRLRPCL
jgi:hypothetical protein